MTPICSAIALLCIGFMVGLISGLYAAHEKA